MMTPTDNFRRQKTELILPKQVYHDKFLITMSKVFGWLRWLGVAGNNSVTWKLWGAVILMLLLAIEVGAIWKVIKALAGWAFDTAAQRSVADRLAGAMFYGSVLLNFIQIWRLSCSWEDISHYWESVERSLNIKHVPIDRKLTRKMYYVLVFVSTFSIIEHLLSILSALDFGCEISQCMKMYILKSHGFMILESDYGIWLAFPLIVMSNIATVLWNLPELLIILISIGLISRYQRLNKCIATVSSIKRIDKELKKNEEVIRVYTWRKIREAFVKQSMLVRKIDRVLGSLVLTSNFFNFYFICLKLFLLITQCMADEMLTFVCFVFTLIWLLIRTAGSILAAADVIRSSRFALTYLYECQPQFYNVEIERLQEQLNREHVALSGMGFFYLTRTMILKMGAAVITYVLVLIQYDNSGRDGDPPKNITFVGLPH